MARKKVVKEEAAKLPQDELIKIEEVSVMDIVPLEDDTPKGLKSFKSGVVVQSVENLRHHGDGSVTMDVLFAHVGTVIPFAANPTDEHEHGKWLYEEALKGTFGDIAEYDRPLPTVHDLQVELDKLMPDIILGLADESEISLAKALRIQIKAMS